MSWGVKSLVSGFVAAVVVFNLLYALSYEISYRVTVPASLIVGGLVGGVVSYFNPKNFYQRMIGIVVSSLVVLAGKFSAGFYFRFKYNKPDGTEVGEAGFGGGLLETVIGMFCLVVTLWILVRENRSQK